MRAWSIWTRLLLAVGVIACIAGGLLAAGMVLVLQAQRDFSTLAIDRIPRVALAGELAEFTGDLAALSAGIMAGALDPAAAPANPGPRVAAAAQGIGAVLASPGLRDIGGAAQLRAAEADLRHSLTDFTSVAAELDALATVLQSADEQLRWTHGDVQDQAGALLEDFSFNMDSQVLVLVSDPDPVRRAGAEVALERDRRLRDRLQRLATEAATLSALVLQARGVADPDALDQVERLGQDTLDTIALLRADLPVQTDVDLLLEGVDRLERLAQGPDGVFAMMRRQLNLREATVAHLSGAQASLGTMQAHLTEIGKAERLAAQSLADDASHRIFSGAVWLGALSVLGAVVGGGILLLFVRNRIVRQIRALTDDLMRIADGPVLSVPAGLRGQDEIARMAHAVEVFRTSVWDLQAAHLDLSTEVAERRRAVERLEITQRELVQAGKMAALGQMSAAISHEINQPLAAMRHRLHNLRLSQPQASSEVAKLEAMTDRISATINHLRRIARRSDHRRMQVRLAEPVLAALDLLDHRIRAESVEIVRDPALDDVSIEGDEILVEHVLLNVFGNALDAIAETGAGQGRIRLTLGPGPDVVVVIEDTGVGLRGRTGADLVDPFFTTKEVGKGLGLGLSIAFNVMQDMGGHLEIGPGQGQGACVRLRFRRWQKEAADE